MKLVLIGSPGAGKGTQAKMLCKKFGLAHISTGDLLRDEMKNNTNLGKRISQIMNEGGLVSDEIVSEMLTNRVNMDDAKNGFILDGYPRNVSQAKGLSKIVGDIDKAICYDVDDSVIVERMVGRRSCPNCGKMYHLTYNPSKIDGICDDCKATLIQREDDNEAIVAKRLKVYHESTAPIIDFYKDKGILMKVNGVGDIDVIFNTVSQALEELN